jgi:hypothetical protein
MRIVISSPPRSGNHWLKCLLSRIYDLEWLPPSEQVGHKPHEVQAWVQRGGFRDDSIYFQHCRFTDRLCDALEAAPAHLVTIIRDPYDVFVSYYHWVQERVARGHGRERAHKRDVLAGRPLNDPIVLSYIAETFGSNIAQANGWLHSGRAVVVRYEGLHDDPVAELTRATAQIEPVDQARIEMAIEACRSENMRQMKPKFTWQVRAATVGDSRQHLDETALAVFREHHHDTIRSLGYDVR